MNLLLSKKKYLIIKTQGLSRRLVNLMSHFFILLSLIIFTSLSSNAQETYVNLNISDCANCSIALNDLLSVKSLKHITVVAPSKFEKEDAKIRSLYGFNRFNKVELIYSDSLSAHLISLNNGNATSAVFIYNSCHSLIYKSTLKTLDVAAATFYGAFSKSRKIRIKELKDKNIKSVKYADGGLACSDYFGNLYIFDLFRKKKSRILMDSNYIANLYKFYYGHNYSSRYPVIRRALDYNGNMRPKIESFSTCRIKKDIHVAIVYTVRDFRLNAQKDTVIFINQFICDYNLSTNEKVFYLKDQSQRIMVGKNMGIRQIAFHNKTPHMYFYNALMYPYKKEVFLGEIEYRKSASGSNKFRVQKKYEGIRPLAYEDKVGKSFVRIATLSENLIVFAYADSLYSIDSGKYVSIPCKKKIYEKGWVRTIWYETFYDAFAKNFSIFYLQRYKENNQKKVSRHLIVFDRNGNLIEDKSVEKKFREYSFDSISLVHSYQIVGVDGHSGEICFVDL